MQVRQARLIKRKTDDGLVSVEDDVPLGKIYSVYPETKREAMFIHLETNTHHIKEIVDVVNGQYFFTELLEILEEKDNGVEHDKRAA